jgi:hypothetical protein
LQTTASSRQPEEEDGFHLPHIASKYKKLNDKNNFENY